MPYSRAESAHQMTCPNCTFFHEVTSSTLQDKVEHQGFLFVGAFFFPRKLAVKYRGTTRSWELETELLHRTAHQTHTEVVQS